MYSQQESEDYWAFYAAHPHQPCTQCAKQHLKEMNHWLCQGRSQQKYASLRARINEVLQKASPIDRERLCIEHILKQEDIYMLRDWFYHYNMEPNSELVELAFVDQLKAIWQKSKSK